jgi:hypothetical protein
MGSPRCLFQIKIKDLPDHSAIPQLMESIIKDYKLSLPETKRVFITYPGRTGIILIESEIQKKDTGNKASLGRDPAIK